MKKVSESSFNALQPTYMLMQIPFSYVLGVSTLDIPIYESYFSQPYTATADSIFISTLFSDSCRCNLVFYTSLDTGFSESYHSRNIYTNYSDDTGLGDYYPSSGLIVDDTVTYLTIPQELPHQISAYITLMFPILTPDPNADTTGQGGDTTGVDTTGANIYSPQLLERYTQLIPSVVEAGGTATVLSSFHLQAVELYDAAGRLVQSRPARGTAATVDCTALPRGSYLVRLVTTAGTTTKKLTVR